MPGETTLIKPVLRYFCDWKIMMCRSGRRQRPQDEAYIHPSGSACSKSCVCYWHPSWSHLVEREHDFWASPKYGCKPCSHVNRAEQDGMILYMVTLLTLDCTRGFHQVQSHDPYLLFISEREGETIQNALSDFGV
jgi:hypothetical protein